MNPKKFQDMIEKEFGSRIAFLGYQLVMLATMQQPCDITFYKRKPILDVKIDQQLALALMYGAGAKKLAEMLSAIRLSNGESVNISDIWTVHPMPADGFTKEQLEAVDLATGEQKYGPNGETLRKMISDTYHCQNKKEEDFFLRRYIAS